MAKKHLSFIPKLVLILSIPVFLILTNLYFFFSPFFIRYEYQKDGFPQSRFFNEEERLSIANAVLDYVKNDKDITTLQNDYPLFSERELSHLVDVKSLINRVFTLQKFSGLLIILSMLSLLTDKNNRKRIFFYVFLGCLVTILIVSIVIILVYLNFDCFFIRFHQLFFSGDSWLFNQSDTLIQLFPEIFWFDAVKILMLVSVSEAFLIAFIMWFMMFKDKEKLNKLCR